MEVGGWWVGGFGFRVSGFGSRVSGFGSRVSGFGFRVQGAGYTESTFTGQASQCLGSRARPGDVEAPPTNRQEVGSRGGERETRCCLSGCDLLQCGWNAQLQWGGVEFCV